MIDIKISPLGVVAQGEKGCRICLDAPYRAGLKGLEDFGHIMVLWWAHGCDSPGGRAGVLERAPYAQGPDELGVFATRSPRRPNPIMVSTAGLVAVDETEGVLLLDWLDAAAGSPVLDIKPYTPSADRVEAPGVPDWCRHWPQSVEASALFDWSSVFAEA